MDGARTIVATPVGTLLVWSNGADELLACTLSADDKASWTYRDVPGVAAVAETISVNRRPRTLGLRLLGHELVRLGGARRQRCRQGQGPGGAAVVLRRMGRQRAGPCAAAPGGGPPSDRADRPPRPGGRRA